MYPPQDLAALVAIADTGSVRAAAGRLGRTQPAITQAIRRLEHAVGFSLLDRSGYRVRLTDRGDAFVKRARTTVYHANGLRFFASHLAKGIEPRLRISCHGAIPSDAWIGLVDKLTEQFPDTSLELALGEGEAPMRSLMNNESQLAVILGPSLTYHSLAVEHVPLGDLEFVNIVHTDLVNLLQQEHSLLPQVIVADFDDPASNFAVADGNYQLRVSNHSLKATLIENGNGWGSVPAYLVEQSLARGRVSAIPHKGLAARALCPFRLCRRRDGAVGPVGAHIWEAAKR